MRSAGKEFYNKGANVQLGPGLCVARVPRNGRNFEYISGEDPYLGYHMSAAVTKGIQVRYPCWCVLVCVVCWCVLACVGGCWREWFVLVCGGVYFGECRACEGILKSHEACRNVSVVL